jgi:hypothetical protein
VPSLLRRVSYSPCLAGQRDDQAAVSTDTLHGHDEIGVCGEPFVLQFLPVFLSHIIQPVV